jgi:hypothetical protein
MPSERTRALRWARELLAEIQQAELWPTLPEPLRRQARVILRHFPTDAGLEQLHRRVPWLIGPAEPTSTAAASDFLAGPLKASDDFMAEVQDIPVQERASTPSGGHLLPLWFPDPQYVDRVDRAGAVTIERLCELAHTPCRASGAWTQRPVVLHVLEGALAPWLRAEREDYGAVEIGVPPLDGSAVEQARWALGCLAYSPLRDLVALASCKGQHWARISPDMPPARPQLSAQVQAFVEELAQLYLRHGLAIGSSAPDGELWIDPLSDDAIHALRHALPRGAAG